MAGEIIVPTLGESVSEATVAKWFKKVGDSVAMDEPLVELETDKVTMEVNSPFAGALKEIKVAEGQTVEVGALLGMIEVGAAGSVAAAKPATAPVVQAAPVAASAPQSGPAARKLLEETGIPVSSIAGTGKDGRITKGDVISATVTPAPSTQNLASAKPEERVKMSKLRQVIAKRLKDSQNTAAILTTFNEIDMSNVRTHLRKNMAFAWALCLFS